MCNIQMLEGYYRHDVIKLLKKDRENIGVELGVAEGIFSSRMVNSGVFSDFIGIDKYGDMHDTNEYKNVLKNIGLFARYKLLRMTFEEAYDLFDDNSLDFIYIDGYAHTGEEGGVTIFDWSKKVKIGGVIAGDDYHLQWPLVQEAVDQFVELSGFDMYLTTEIEDNPYSNFPSWAVIKTSSTEHLFSPKALVEKGSLAKRPKKSLASYMKIMAHAILPKKIIKVIKKILNK